MKKTLNFKNITFPVGLNDILLFEKQNPNIPPINVFSLNNNDTIYPLRLNNKSCQNTIDLFLYEKDEESHSLIKNFSRLVSSQITKDTRPKYFCKKCLSFFFFLFNKHISYCLPNKEIVAVKMPPQNSSLYFKNYNSIIKLPFSYLCRF